MNVTQVEPIGLTVHLQSRSGLDGFGHQALDRNRRLAPADLARGRMRDAIHVRVVHRSENALGGIALEGSVQRADHPVEPRELLVGKIHGTVGANS